MTDVPPLVEQSSGDRDWCSTADHPHVRAVALVTCEGEGAYPYCRACTDSLVSGGFETIVEEYPSSGAWNIVYQVCPVCGGRGRVPAGFYNTSPAFSSSSTADEVCRRCKGSMTIPTPPLAAPREYAQGKLP